MEGIPERIPRPEPPPPLRGPTMREELVLLRRIADAAEAVQVAIERIDFRLEEMQKRNHVG